MKQNDKHLNIDLGFLDDNAASKDYSVKNKNFVSTSSKKNSLLNNSSVSSDNLKNKLIIVGIFLLFGWAFLSDDNSSESQNANSNSSDGIETDSRSVTNNGENVIVGEYSCSRYDASQAEMIEPANDIKNRLDADKVDLGYRSTELDGLAKEIEETYVDESSQFSIDYYNGLVNVYNSKLNSYKEDAKNFDVNIDHYNEQVNRYNNYLENNCTKVK